MIVRSRAPLRIGLAGGGTDVSPYCDQYGGSVLNASIDRFAYANIRALDEPKVRFVATDQMQSCEFPLAEYFSLDGNLVLHKGVYNAIINTFNNGLPVPIELTTFCDAPAGSGLGSSSTLVVAMIKAFAEFFNLPLDDSAIARLAFKIERIDCQLMGGRQDQYSATFGGFNFMEFYAEERVSISPLHLKNWIICELEASLVLFYTGVSRESANIIAEQNQNMQNEQVGFIDAFHGLKHESIQMRDCLLTGDFDGLVATMQSGWKNKKRSANAVTNESINNIYESAIRSGALAGKVSGAGGGGFMLFYVPPTHRMDVIRVLQKYPGQVSNAHFTKNGAQAWKIL